ncbi:hypothetical protein [Bacillus coreaensis]
MAFDFDPFTSIELDINKDGVIDGDDIKLLKLQNGLSPDMNDLNNDNMLDQFQKLDFNTDGYMDKFQADLNGNTVIDKFEKQLFGPEMNMDINGDGRIDVLDEILIKEIYAKR